MFFRSDTQFACVVLQEALQPLLAPVRVGWPVRQRWPITDKVMKRGDFVAVHCHLPCRRSRRCHPDRAKWQDSAPPGPVGRSRSGFFITIFLLLESMPCANSLE
jgi:hypothetical protein